MASKARSPLHPAEMPSLFDPPRRADQEGLGAHFPMVGDHPWGWGAVMVDSAPPDWLCADCGKRPRGKQAGRHWYLFGPQRCSDCARAWCEKFFPRN